MQNQLHISVWGLDIHKPQISGGFGVDVDVLSKKIKSYLFVIFGFKIILFMIDQTIHNFNVALL